MVAKQNNEILPRRPDGSGQAVLNDREWGVNRGPEVSRVGCIWYESRFRLCVTPLLRGTAKDGVVKSMNLAGALYAVACTPPNCHPEGVKRPKDLVSKRQRRKNKNPVNVSLTCPSTLFIIINSRPMPRGTLFCCPLSHGCKLFAPLQSLPWPAQRSFPDRRSLSAVSRILGRRRALA